MFYDYNGEAKAFWWIIVVLGAVVIVHSVAELALLPPQAQMAIGLAIALAGLAAAFPVDLRSVQTVFASRAHQARARLVNARIASDIDADVMRDADTAMYAAKSSNSGPIVMLA